MMVGTTPYIVLHAFLPIDSRVSRNAADVPLEPLASVAISQSAAALSHVLRLFETHVLAPSEIAAYLTLLDVNLRSAASGLRHELAERERTASRDASDSLTDVRIQQEIADKKLT